MKIHCSYDELIKRDTLKFHPENHNQHPKEQLDRLAKILSYQGWRVPIRVSKLSGFITAGHGRAMAAELNGWDEVPVQYQDYENAAQEFADVQADNAIASWAELDLSGINADLELHGPELDLDMLGLRSFKLDPMENAMDENVDEKELDDSIETKKECPECGYKW